MPLPGGVCQPLVNCPVSLGRLLPPLVVPPEVAREVLWLSGPLFRSEVPIGDMARCCDVVLCLIA